MTIIDLEYQHNQPFFYPPQRLLGEMPPSGRPRHDSAYERLANHAAPLKHNYASTSRQPTTMPSALLSTHHRSHTKKVRFASNVVDNERRPTRTISPIPRPESPPHTGAMSSLAHKASKGASKRSSSVQANTSRPMKPAPSRLTTPSRQHGPANTSAKRHSSSSTSVSSKGGHGTSKPTHLRGGDLNFSKSSKRKTPDHHSPKKMIGLPVYTLPAVPEAPIRQGPPPTPRPARLPTPELDDISYRRFCACDDSGCRCYVYPHDFNGRQVSKMETQSKATFDVVVKSTLTIHAVQAAQSYMKSLR